MGEQHRYGTKTFCGGAIPPCNGADTCPPRESTPNGRDYFRRRRNTTSNANPPPTSATGPGSGITVT